MNKNLNKKDWKLIKWRGKAHKTFDKFWKDWGYTRGQSYKLLTRIMGMPPQEAHIGQFTLEQCQTLIERINKELEKTNFNAELNSMAWKDNYEKP